MNDFLSVSRAIRVVKGLSSGTVTGIDRTELAATVLGVGTGVYQTR